MPRQHAHTTDSPVVPASAPTPERAFGRLDSCSPAGHSFGGVSVGGTTPLQAKAPEGAGEHLEVRPSPIHGKGLFARAGFRPGEPIETGATARETGEGGRAWEVTPEARYTNHHDAPNAKLTTSGGKLLMSAGRSIRPGEEVTVDYDEVGERIGDGRLTWRGETVPSGPEAEAFFRADGE